MYTYIHYINVVAYNLKFVRELVTSDNMIMYNFAAIKY